MVSSHVTTPESLQAAIDRAREVGRVLLEEFVRGEELRLVVMVASSWPRPRAATDGTCSISIDAESQGATIRDLTPTLHPALLHVAQQASRALDMPVLGLDLIVPALDGPDHWIIEANARPGLANHEPQPTAARFVDLLFPETSVSR